MFQDIAHSENYEIATKYVRNHITPVTKMFQIFVFTKYCSCYRLVILYSNVNTLECMNSNPNPLILPETQQI